MPSLQVVPSSSHPLNMLNPSNSNTTHDNHLQNFHIPNGGIETYYNGLPSCPALIAKSNPKKWVQPRSPIDSGYPDSKMLLPVDASHPIKGIWDKPLGKELLNTIDKHTNHATSVDIVKICFESEINTAPPIIWIGVEPSTMSPEIGEQLVRDCLELLQRYQMFDVEVEIKESSVHR